MRVAYYKDASGNLKIDRTTNFYPFGLEFGGDLSTANSISPNYKYSSQGQEKQTETGWSSYRWRNYDASMARFFNVDPLAEQYHIWSTYAFSGNRVVDARELEGLEPVPLPIYAPGIVAAPPGYSVKSGAGSAVYEQMKSNAVNNYNGLMRGLAAQISVIAAVGITGISIANRVLNNDNDKKDSKSEKDSTEKGKAKSGRSKEKGVVYEVPEDGTESGVPYVGRTKKGNPSKRGGKDDGRDRKKAKVIDEYDPKNPEEGAFKEQKAIDERGGIGKLDNKRNEMNPERFNKVKAKYER
ncbi:RHS repeat-associated core domain-containing protein [Chryseobacterium sp. PvR013]|uniref:RHS repeat-associated core domain-containing protein n=1 Tax=Chryseobacterium sp. PvR013 TaxID=2806595 RepID=UPI001AE9735A